MTQCKCGLCETVPHDSDCAVHNEPATRNGDCDCRDGWISVDDRLPQANTEVLVFNRYRFIGVIEENGTWFAAVDYETLFNVTHWQPLPKPPTS
jgi:hypothetical protein